ncbi:MAG: sulfatase, partial [Verrucomicrobiae bacterium]|nr:sulfatase [Verrucomicrobiae bacterium]
MILRCQIARWYLISVLSLIPFFSDLHGKEPLNLLFIAIDDMNNWVNAWGGQAITPNIDRLAREGIQFRNAHCVSPACNPSRTALLTGQRPETTGQFDNPTNFRDKPGGLDRITLPQFLMARGYETVSAGKVFHKQRGLGQNPLPMSDPVSWSFQWKGPIGTTGIERYRDKDGHGAWLEGADSFEGLPIVSYIRDSDVWGPIDLPKEECGDWQMAEFCARYLKEDHEKPFFLACGIFRPHSPQLAPREYFDLYPPESIQMPDSPEPDMVDIPPSARTNFSTGYARLLRAKGMWRTAVRAYLACMSFADDCVGLVIDALEESQYRDNTVVVFWSDHGWQLGHKDRWEKFTLWHQSTNAPMIIRFPQMTNPVVCDTPVSYIDIYPTVLELLGYERPEYLEGHSLMPLLRDVDVAWPYPAVVSFNQSHSVEFKHWNYILYEDGSEELYDHRSDPT